MDFSKIDEGHDDGEAPLTFHYNRDERIARAPDLVKKYYNNELSVKRGLFRVLVSTRGNKMMLFVLVVTFIIVAFLGFFGPSKNEASVGGVSVALTAFSYEETVYVSLKFNPPQKKFIQTYADAETVASAQFFARDADNQVLFTEKAHGIYGGQEMFLRTSFTDYDIFSIEADVELNGTSKHLKASVEKR